MVLIAFEGPSGVGKSTLIQLVSERTGLPAITRDPVVRNFRVTQGHHDIFVLEQMSILNKIPWEQVDVMIDRMPVVSQWVYDRVDKREGEVPYFDLGMIPADTAFVYLSRAWDDPYKRRQQEQYEVVMPEIKARHPTISIRTDQTKVYECVRQITEWVGRISNGKKL